MKGLKWFFRITIIGIFLFILSYFGIYLVAYFKEKLPIESANSYFLYDQNSNLYTGTNQDWIDINKISPHLLQATISIEDKNFYEHIGFDYLRILKAFYINLKSGKTIQGASTITQQYAKNLFLVFDKTWSRKLEEAWLTIRLETHYKKDEILEGYLNTINYGGIFGIENASKYYFNKSASDLSLAEATILAGIPKGPSLYSPFVNEANAKARQLLILNSMVKNGYITEEEKKEAYQEELVYNTGENDKKLNTLMYYKDAVMRELETLNSIPKSFLETGGLKIYTNLDYEAQAILEENMVKNLQENPSLQVSSIMVEPSSGKVIALIGGRDYSKSQYNRALSSKRQVGSTIKPFLYYSALENGFTASTTFTSSKTTFTFGENQTYSPNNFNDKYADKPISMAAALAYSDNIYAVKTHIFLGEDVLVDTAKRVGISNQLTPIPSLALGSQELSMMDMITGYTTLANEGYKIEPYFIEKVEDMYGNVLYEYKDTKEKVLNKSIVYILDEMMSNCYNRNFIDYNYPTCINIAPKVSKKYAVKTGSTDTDTLIFGFNSDLLLGVWNGYDDNSKIDNKDGVYNKNIWIDTMEAYFKEKESHWYDIPSNVVGTLVDPISGEVATEDSKKSVLLYYMKGTEPYLENQDLDSLIPTMKED